ncbi:cobalt-precorrin 5A hydrolase [Roseburia sp. 499]|uniref:cobalt-precorrin 5A hydrolase n=1 Tax=Roseburia sp. 499 TaxID=1261634 RepID=UPI0009522304|nr:cobalt-precorrin 5A hydrolase [Roseburia sp. 499]WVK70715.1 cobalt-precorrin 5A hydrolase [Roseburia sp. 499]
MQIEIISFTEQGSLIVANIKKELESYGKVQVTNGKKMERSLQEWCENAFLHAQLLIFVGATGIAVRAIAPFIKDKFTDPAVLVVDEKGKYVIPILSGHVGKANEYADYLAEKLSATAVITTATDLNGKFAVDVFARKNQLVIRDRAWAKEISAGILQGEKVGFFSEGNVIGDIPKDLVLRQSSEEEHHIYVGIHTSSYLIPKAVTLGVGCRKGKSAEELEQFILKQLEQQHIALESIACVASVDKKKEEPGIIAFCQKYGFVFQTFSPEQLKEVSGEFTESAFVEENIGVGNVCERAAVCGQNHQPSHVILPKTAENGMTLAIVEREWSVTFE